MTNNRTSSTRPVVTVLHQSKYVLLCAWCEAVASYDVDGTSACWRHYSTAYLWAEAKRIGR